MGVETSQQVPSDDDMSQGRLRVLDFRPERVWRAELISLGQAVWPPTPPPTKGKTSSDSNSKSRRPIRVQQSDERHFNWEEYAFVEGRIQCNLPYIELPLIDALEAFRLLAHMDDQHIVMTKAR